MDLIDKISLGILDMKAKAIIAREIRASDRAAGRKTVINGHVPYYKAPISNYLKKKEVKEKTDLKDSDTRSLAENAIEKACDAEVLAESAIIKADEAITATHTLKAMAEEAIYKAHEATDAINEMADSQAPEEEPGAEKISAAMGTIVRPAHDNPEDGKIDMSIFGMTIDNDALCGYEQKPVLPNTANPQPVNPVIPYPAAPNPYAPQYQQPLAGGYVLSQYQQIPQDPSLKSKFFDRQMNNGASSKFIRTSDTPVPGSGLHKVDNPTVQKPAAVKNKPEDIPTNIPDIVETIPFTPKIDAKDINLVTDVEPVEESGSKPAMSIFNNNTMISKYPFLRGIENIAIANGYQIYFVMKQNGTDMIECHVCDLNGNAIAGKGFTIDNGNIIDGRKKVFPVIDVAYEPYTAYALFSKSGGTSKTIDEDLIKSLIIGGAQAVTQKPLFNQSYIDLNKVVALITIPSNKLKKDDRKYIQSRLMDVFMRTDILKKYVGRTRFKISGYDNGTITLNSNGVPLNFGCPVVSVDNLTIKITKDSVEEIV